MRVTQSSFPADGDQEATEVIPGWLRHFKKKRAGVPSKRRAAALGPDWMLSHSPRSFLNRNQDAGSSLSLILWEFSMQRVTRPPVRNRINLADPKQVRVWTRRLNVTPDTLKAVIAKVGESVVTVTKEIELQRSGQHSEPIQSSGTHPE
jgi:hypothetical protein